MQCVCSVKNDFMDLCICPNILSPDIIGSDKLSPDKLSPDKLSPEKLVNYETIIEVRPKVKIVFDWDDTLFPTSWLIEINGGYNLVNNLYVEIKMKEYIPVLISTIKMAKSLGEVIIITNARRYWVIDCLSFWLKDVKGFFDNITVISARDCFASFLPEDNPTMWKCMAFDRELTNCDMMISIGDSDAEKDGIKFAKEATKTRIIIKTIKLVENPSITELMIQHIKLLNKMENMFNDSQNYDFFI